MFPSETPIGTILTKEHIEALTIDQLQQYHQQTFTENNIRIFATGNLDDEMIRRCGDEMMQKAERRKEKGEKSPSNFERVDREAGRGSLYQIQNSKFIIETRENALQSSFILCKKSIGYTHEDRRNFEILSTLYGGYFGSRLMQNLREENGYTYGVFCSSLFYENESVFYIEADVVVEKTKAAINECFNEMMLLQNKLVSEEELSLVKTYMLGELLREVDGSVSYQKRYAYWNDFQLNENEMQQMIDTIHAITSQTIQTLAKQYLVPEMFTTIVVGKM
ncbi:MAG: insulinase family protein [Bacteroidetes bacterium]|nr:insulinase family protein [Bacteroidota bacterium]MCL2303343.1 insulinase family protein [Lentimicrobiaceae bacterium]